MRVVGALLAGGESRRMGQDKAGVVVEGRTLAERAVATLAAVSDEVVVLGHGRACPEGLARIPDLAAGEGASSALRALLRSGRGDVYVVLPVDMPGVEPAQLRALLDARGDRLAACFARDGRIEPLPMVLAAGAPLGPDRKLALLLEALAPARVPLAVALKNINYPGDLDP